MFERSSAAISPTAHYTGEVWRRNGLSDPALGTWEGRLLHGSVRPLEVISTFLGGPTLEGFLLARHRLIDRILSSAIESGEIGQVVEIAAGLSPRGLRMCEKHPGITYVEADLPGMAARKREALAGTSRHEGHRVVDLDALADDGPLSLDALAGDLDAGAGVAVVTEGLLNYFPLDAVQGIWRRIAAALARFPAGLYASDLHLESDNSSAADRVFLTALSGFVRGQVHVHFDSPGQAEAALEAAGFSTAVLHSGREGGSGRGAERVRVIEARV